MRHSAWKVCTLFLFVLLPLTSFAGYERSILIDPGHGGPDHPGAEGYDGNVEKTVTLQLADKLHNSLTFGANGSGEIINSSNIYKTRTGDDHVPVEDRARMAKGEIADAFQSVRPRDGSGLDYGVDVFLSIHCNSGSDHGTSGHIWDETDWNHNVDESSPDFDFAELLVQQYVDETSEEFAAAKIAYQSQTGVVGRNGLVILDDTHTKNSNGFPKWVTLLETEFVSNSDSWDALQNSLYQEAAADGMALGIRDFLDTIVGIGDYVNIESYPQNIDPNSQIYVSASTNQASTIFACKLFAKSLQGDVELVSEVDVSSMLYPLEFDLDVPSLSQWNNTWLRSETNSNFIQGYLKVTNGSQTNEVSDYQPVKIYSPPTTSGTLTHDEHWAGTIHIDGGLSVDNNSTLTLAPGTVVSFDGDYNMSVKAGSRILANGSESAPIYFTSTNGTSRQSWGTLYVNGSNNSFKWCTVEYGDWGLKLYGNPDPASNNTIEHSTFRQNDMGLRLERNEVVAKNNVIHDNRHGIVTINNTEVEFHGNHVYNNDRDGIYSISNNYLQFYGNVIENNGVGAYSTRNGIYTRNGDNIELGDLNGGIWGGYNTIRNNFATEVYAGYGDPVVEILEASIHDNSGDEVYNYPGNPTIDAYWSWWGEYPPNYNQIEGDVGVFDPLSSAPNWEGTTQTTGWLPKSGSTDHPAPPTPALIARLKQTVRNNFGTSRADSALARLNFYVRRDYKANTLGERNRYGGFLTQLYTGRPHTPEGQRALRYLIAWKTINNDIQEAVDLSQVALTNSPASYRLGLLENLVYLHLYTGDVAAAQQTLTTIEADYPDRTETIDFLAETLAEEQEVMAREQGLAKQDAEQPAQSSVLPETVVLRPNYPNPFNPTTTMVYALPGEQHVRLEIYDVKGNHVQTLLNTVKPAGYHAVQWDGTNDRGQTVSSGVYFYRLTTSSEARNRKMLLIR